MSKVLQVRLNSKVRSISLKGNKLPENLTFKNKVEFERFVKYLNVLLAIKLFRPKSVYELAKKIEMDVSNLAKIVSLYERFGVVRMEIGKFNGRKVSTPKVLYDAITFQISAMKPPPPGRAMLAFARRR